MKLSDGIKSYEGRIIQILSWMPDWLDQNEFDRLARTERGPVLYYVPESYILHWSGPDLHLLLLMVKEKLVEREMRNGLIFYRAARS